MAGLTIDDTDWAERARLQCPEGHGWWEASGTSWYCRTCGCTYDEFLDAKTGEWVAPSDVRFLAGHRTR